MGIEPTIDWNPEQKKMIHSLLDTYLPHTQAWVYGSRAEGTARPHSDLDMVVFTKPEQNPQVSQLRDAFEESNLPFRVDLFIWDEVPDAFRRNIRQHHVVLKKNLEVE